MAWPWKKKSVRTGVKEIDLLLDEGRPWGEGVARLFACDCAQHVASFFSDAYPKEQCPRQALHLIRKFCGGQIPEAQLEAVGQRVKEVAGQAASEHATRTATSRRDAPRYGAASKAAFAVVYAAWTAPGGAEHAVEIAGESRAWLSAWMAAGAPPWTALAVVSAEEAAAYAAMGPEWMRHKGRRELTDGPAAEAERQWQIRKLVPYLRKSLLEAK